MTTSGAVASPTPSPRATARLASIDIFRGLTVAGMILVNDPGDPDNVFAPLKHSVWHGWTPTDLVFPFFLFVVGVTTQLSLARRESAGDDARTVFRAAARRGALIFAFGLLITGYPFYENPAVAGLHGCRQRWGTSWRAWPIFASWACCNASDSPISPPRSSRGKHQRAALQPSLPSFSSATGF